MVVSILLARLLFNQRQTTQERFFCSCDLDPMTSICKPDLAVLRTHLHTNKYYYAAFAGGKNKASILSTRVGK